ncbi:hypothetical protein BHL53_06905 [Bacillus cereus]|nr:hypothetical protein BHL53_06905 [Bacillus cereus]
MVYFFISSLERMCFYSVLEAYLWLDFVSINSYLTGEKDAYALLRYLRYLKERNIHYKNMVPNTRQTSESYADKYKCKRGE